MPKPPRDQHTDTSVESFFERCGEPAAWTTPSGFPKELKPVGLFTQKVSNGLEVVLVEAETKPQPSWYVDIPQRACRKKP